MAWRVQTAVTEHVAANPKVQCTSTHNFLRTPAALLNSGTMCAVPTTRVSMQCALPTHLQTDAQPKTMHTSTSAAPQMKPPHALGRHCHCQWKSQGGRRLPNLQLTEGAPYTPMRLRCKANPQRQCSTVATSQLFQPSPHPSRHAATPGNVLRRSAADTTRHPQEIVLATQTVLSSHPLPSKRLHAQATQ